MNYSTKRAVHFLVGVFPALLLRLFANTAYAQNTISTVAGGPPPNNVAPTAAAATLEGPQAIVRDPFGNFFVTTDSGVIYKVTPPATLPSVMSIYAGNNTAGFSANGTAATSTLTNEPYGAAVDANGNLYYSDSNNCVVREIVGGVVETVAGNGTCGFSGGGGTATSASLNFPQGIAIDSSGNLYIADLDNSVIRRVDSSGNITTYAGTPNTTGFPGNGILASSALLYAPVAVAVDTTGNLFISDENDNVICRVDAASKIITIVAGTGAFGYSGDGALATAATIWIGSELCADAWSVWDWIRALAGDVVSVRDGMDLQEAAAVGNFVWIADNFRGGDDGVQQRGEITERIGNASGKLSFGRDCNGAEWGSIQRQFDAEGAIAPGGVAERDFGFGVAALL